MNTIFTRQNEPRNIDLLCAQKQLYIEAKRVFKFQIILTCITILVTTLLKFFFSFWKVDISAIVLVINTLIGAIDILLMMTIASDFKKKAAKAQEQFDCAVYELSWNKTFIGSGPNSSELINKYCRKFLNAEGDVSKLYNWYAIELSRFSGYEAILHCQRSSLIYDTEIRNRFRWFAIKVTFWPILLFLLITIFVDESITTSILFMLSFWPLGLLALKIRHEQKKAITYSEETKSIIDSLLGNILNVNERDVRDVQNRMFTNRKDGPVIPETFYVKLRNKLEEEMHHNARNT